MAMTNAERQRKTRDNRKKANLLEIRGIFIHKNDKDALRKDIKQLINEKKYRTK